MANSPQSIRIPPELDSEVDRFIEDTGIYTSKSEFIRESVRLHLHELQSDAGVLALRLNQALAHTERCSERENDEIHETLDEIAADLDPDMIDEAINVAEEEVAEAIFEESEG